MSKIKTYEKDFAWEDFNKAIIACREQKLFSEANLIERVKISLISMVNPAIDNLVEQMNSVEYNCRFPDSSRPEILRNISLIIDNIQPILSTLQKELRPKEH